MSKKELYRQFCRQEKDLPLFFQDWYLDAVCQDGEWDVAFVEESGKVVAALPFFVKRKWIARYVTMPVFTRHLGVYLTPEKRNLNEEQRLFPALMEQLPQVDFFVQNFSPEVTNWLPFYWAGYRQTTRYTYVLPDLTNLDAIIQGMSRDIRRNIKKGESQLEIKTDLSLETFFEVQKRSFDRQAVEVPFSFRQLKILDETLVEHHSRQLFFATDGQDIHAATYLVWDKQRSYFLLGGYDPRFRKSGAYTYLTWECIRFTRDVLGLQIFDFAGSMMPQIEPVRRRFGAVQQSYFTIWKNYAWWAKALLRYGV